MLSTEYIAPFIWAGAATVGLGVTWVLRNAFQKGIGDIVETKLEPLNERVDGLESRERQRDHLRIVPPAEEQQQ